MGLLSARDITGMRDTLREVSNATLTAVLAAGAPDRRGKASDGTTLWSGTAHGFLERAETSTADVVRGMSDMPQRARVDHTDTFTILDAEGAYLAELAGPDWAASRVTIVDNRTAVPVTTTFRVVEMEHAANSTLDSVVLLLDRGVTA